MTNNPEMPAPRKTAPRKIALVIGATGSFGGHAAAALGMWRTSSHEKNWIASSVEERRTRRLAARLIAVAANANPENHAQKRRAGIHAGTSVATNFGYMKC